mmetsp:Transcript_21370/g.50799  ORF Transcript_21370/g.50799 Transcript_21370/m.50799 type:complete len:143 (-) Transcript_21370:132-560(-)
MFHFWFLSFPNHNSTSCLKYFVFPYTSLSRSLPPKKHWNVYLKWNGRLFQEMYKAYKEGRTQKDPIEFWYKGEIGFFDFYIIPLAKKLKNCGVFGVSSDEYLQYAISNRDEWERKGKSVVEKLIASVQQEIAADTAAADMKL